MKEMIADMIKLRQKLRAASNKDKGLRLNNQEVSWLDELVNNGICDDEIASGDWDA